MKVRELIKKLEQLPGNTKIVSAKASEHEIFELDNLTVETYMGNGKMHVVLVTAVNPLTENARDFEPHPAFEDTLNAWLFEE